MDTHPHKKRATLEISDEDTGAIESLSEKQSTTLGLSD
jgi:hypothetical protein